MFESILTIGFIIALLGWIYNKYKLSVYQQIAEMEDASYIEANPVFTGTVHMQKNGVSLDEISKLIKE